MVNTYIPYCVQDGFSYTVTKYFKTFFVCLAWHHFISTLSTAVFSKMFLQWYTFSLNVIKTQISKESLWLYNLEFSKSRQFNVLLVILLVVDSLKLITYVAAAVIYLFIFLLMFTMMLLVSQMVQLLLVMSTESILLLLFIYLYF